MKTLGVRQIRASYDVLVNTLATEGEVVLTHHGKPFARVLPFEAPVEPPQRKPISMKWLHDQMPMLKEGTDKYIQEERNA
ncbi:MAG: type II toxin-antitoxin system Phd/YefM family antitoxin [Methylophilaceae bacterium]